MAVTVSGIIETNEMLFNLDSTTKRRAVKTLIIKAKEIQALAIKMAPVDDGNLEKAIKMSDTTQPRGLDGRFGRIEVEVYVDMSMPVPDRPDKTVGDYAYEIHEHLTPMGPMQLGEESARKNDSNGGIEVGGGFMTRAADAVDKSIDAALADLLSGL